jgi:signal transduction histidine kinase/phage shock protein PspC (stress-responsive transcriptional regulator)
MKGQSRSGWVRPLAEGPLSRVRFARSRDDALIAGVAGGLGERWGVEPVLVRIAFVVLSFAGAVGVVAYLSAWWVALDPGDRRAGRPREPSGAQNLAFGAVVLGSVLLLRSVGLWLGDPVGIPLLIGAIGAAVVYVGAGRERRPRWARTALVRETPSGRPSLIHLLLGGVLVIGGVTWFLTINRSFNGFFAVLLAVGVTSAGLAIVFGPWVYRMANQLGEERRDRIRSEERAELAAHLHDSVLQTLALIQRNASSPRKMASLARRQERELRTWLYGQGSLAAAQLETFLEMIEAIEGDYEVAIETVVVGDTPLDERSEAVALACLEAATNAARHSGAGEISVYIECEPTQINAYVRDRGKGFDPNLVPDGRRGIADSIRGRIERQGGSVAITSAPGEGCEVQITMPLDAKR